MDPATIMMIASSVGNMLAGIGDFFTSRQQGEAMDAAAKQARRDGGMAAQLELENTDRATARGATLAAASGGGLTGSALTVLDDLSRQGVFNARSQIYAGESEGRNLNYQAKVTRRQGELSLALGFVAGGAGLTAAGKMAQDRATARKALTIDVGRTSRTLGARTRPTPFDGGY